MRKRLRSRDLRIAILSSVRFVGMLSVVLVAPNVIGALGKMGFLPTGKRKKEIINRARDRLVNSGYLQRNKGGFVQLTAKGKRELEKLEQEGTSLKKPRRWDEKWRILVFDIPERKRGVREKIRYTLLDAGFQLLQHSVWVYPYPCEEFVALLKSDTHISKELLYIVTDEIGGDFSLRKRFGL